MGWAGGKEGCRQGLKPWNLLDSVSLSLGVDTSGRGSGKGFACLGKIER